MAVELWLQIADPTPGQVVLDARTPDGRGFALVTADESRLRLDLFDGTTRAAWDTDPGLLRSGRWHHVVAIVDTGPGVISFVVDGLLCDGGEARPNGWGRIDGELRDVSGTRVVRVAPVFRGEVSKLRIYGRALRTSEAVARYHANDREETGKP
jgi:hypothetical protein